MRCDITETVLGNNSAGSFGTRSSIPLLVWILAAVLLACSDHFLLAQEITSEAKSIYAQVSGLSEASDKVRVLRKVLKLSPNDVEARLELAKILMEIGDYSQAKIQVDSTLNYDRGNPYVWFHKGRAHALAGEVQAARKSFERAIKIKNDSPEFYLNLGRLQFRSSAWDRALPAFEKVLSSAISAQSTDEQAEAWYWKGRVHYAKDDTANAVDSFKKALAISPSHEEAGIRLAKIEEQLRLEDSYRIANAAIAQKDWRQAESILQNIIGKIPEFKDAPEKLTIVRNEIRAAQLKLDMKSDPPREEGSKLASKTPIRMEPPPTKLI